MCSLMFDLSKVFYRSVPVCVVCCVCCALVQLSSTRLSSPVRLHHTHKHTHTHTHTCTHTHTHTHTRAHAHTHTHTCMYTHSRCSVQLCCAFVVHLWFTLHRCGLVVGVRRQPHTSWLRIRFPNLICKWRCVGSQELWLPVILPPPE